MKLEFTLNGRHRVMEADGSKRLLDFIREDLQLTGTKEGCGEGECGACTVILDGEAIHACLTMTGQLDGGELWTVEGLEQNGELDSIQKMFIKKGAAQCGYCMSGMAMSIKALLLKNQHPTRDEVKMAIAGNICRCTGYQEIKAAVQAIVADQIEGGEEQ